MLSLYKLLQRSIPWREHFAALGVDLAGDVSVPRPDLVNLYGCHIGKGTKLGPFVEIQRRAHVGENCKVGSHSFICDGVHIGNGVFVGHSVTFINDKVPRALSPTGELQTEADWTLIATKVEDGASIGSGATILCGVTIGRNAVVGAGAVVVRDVPANTIVVGNPAHELRKVEAATAARTGGSVP